MDYIIRFRGIVNNLRELNDPMEDRQYILQMLGSLPPEYNRTRVVNRQIFHLIIICTTISW